MAVIVAVADVGVSPATAMLTLALEAEGVPAVCLTADPGDALARAVSAQQAGGTLALGRLELVANVSAAAVRSTADQAWPAILDAAGTPATVRPWSLPSAAVVEPVRRPDGTLARRIAEFRAIR